MTPQIIISAVILGVVVLPLTFLIFTLFRNELETKETVTAGYGMPVIYGFILVFIVLPVIVFITSLSHVGS